MTQDELSAVYAVIVARAKANLHDVFNEFDARYADTESHGLVAELRQRTDETLDMLNPHPPIRVSGK